MKESRITNIVNNRLLLNDSIIRGLILKNNGGLINERIRRCIIS